MRASNFNFAPKFSQNGFLAPDFALLDENSFDSFLTAENLGVGGHLPAACLPRRHWI